MNEFNKEACEAMEKEMEEALNSDSEYGQMLREKMAMAKQAAEESKEGEK